MKNILLCTTALFGLAAGSAFASEDVAVTFGGQSKFEAGTKSQDSKHKQALSFSPNSKSSAFYTTQKASLKAEGKSDSLTYGAVLRLQMIGNGSDGMGDARNDRSHIYLDTDAGSVQLGSNFSASKLMQVDASTIASATGGIDGDWTNFANTNAYNLKGTEGKAVTYNGNQTLTDANVEDSIANSFAVSSVDTLGNRIDTGESSRKITYLSPKISGVQLGVSFAPDLNNTSGNNMLTSSNVNKDGTVTTVSETYFGMPVRVKNVWSLGLSYTNDFDGVNVAFAAVADKGDAKNQQKTSETKDGVVTKSTDAPFAVNNLRTYSIGAVVGTNGFSVAASYHNDGKSLKPKEEDSIKSSWWTTGVAYENGPMSTSLTYLSGEKKNKDSTVGVKTQVLSLGADYEVAPGLKPFAEVTMVKFKPKNTTVKTDSQAKATVFMLGTKVKF